MAAIEDKIREILLLTLESNYDNGNIEDGGIGGGDDAIKEIAAYIKEQNGHIAQHANGAED